jgi:hippurate hydrolase
MSTLAKITAFREDAVKWRRHLHAHPETAFEEVKTSDYVAALLEGWGVEVHRGIAKTGLVGVIRGDLPGGKSIGLRADMDALNIYEETNAPHRSTVEGKMHACGHDGHTAMLLAAARHLSENRDFAGTVVLIFQPAEEGGGGGDIMVKEGLFDRFPCDAVYGLHNWPYLPEGVFAASTGAITASTDEFKLKITGKGGHAAFPHVCIDPIVIGAQIVTALQTLISRVADPAEMGVVSVTKFQAGTGAYNIIPEVINLGGTVRTTSPSLRVKLENGIRTLTKAIATSMGGDAELDWRHGYPSVVNTEAETAFARDVAAGIVGADKVLPFVPTMGGEDFAYMLQKRPGCYIVMGSGKTDKDPGLHSPKYDFNDDVLPLGAAYLVDLATTYLK